MCFTSSWWKFIGNFWVWLSWYQWSRKDNLLLENYLLYTKMLSQKMKWEWMLGVLQGDWKWWVKRLSEGEKNDFINRRDRKKSHNSRCEWWSDFQITFFLLLKFSTSVISPAGLLTFPLSSKPLKYVMLEVHLYRDRGGLPRVSIKETQVLCVQESNSNGDCAGVQQAIHIASWVWERWNPKREIWKTYSTHIYLYTVCTFVYLKFFLIYVYVNMNMHSTYIYTDLYPVYM